MVTLIPDLSSAIHNFEVFFETTVSAKCYLSRCLQSQDISDLSLINTWYYTVVLPIAHDIPYTERYSVL